MDESKVLSTDEVNALLRVTQENGSDLTKITSESITEDDRSISHKALVNITELTWSECEKLLSSFLRRKITVKSKGFNHGTLADCLAGKGDSHVYTVFLLTPNNYYGLAMVDLPLLHQMINTLYGGQNNDKGPVMATPGKVGAIVGEKIGQIALEAFALACREYGTVTSETIKTVTLPNLISKFSLDDRVYALELLVYFGEVETSLTIMIAEEFLYKFIPANATPETPTSETRSWRNAIEHQFVDSSVTLTVSLPEISIKASELMALKSGDLITIPDPTQVSICLNDTKLFHAKAGQAHNTRVVKILGEI